MQNNPNINIKNKPNDKPNVENQQIGTITPATADEKNICIKACPDAAVPLDFGKQSSAAIEIIGIIAAIPMLYRAMKLILNIGLLSKK